MTSLNDEQVRHLAHDLVAQVLTRIADPEPERVSSLKAAIRNWVPTADEFELRVLADKVTLCLKSMANLVDERKARLIESGRAAPYA